MKRNNICIMGIPQGEDSEQGIENLFEEIMTKNNTNLVNKKDTPTEEAQRALNTMVPNRPTSRHIIIKMAKFKDKERTLKLQKKSS